jgi:hypothetical protein
MVKLELTVDEIEFIEVCMHAANDVEPSATKVGPDLTFILELQAKMTAAKAASGLEAACIIDPQQIAA